MEKEYFDEMIKQYFSTEEYYVKEGSSGMNNTTKFISLNDKDYILRIYESHSDKFKVEFEHEVLKQLHKKKLSFKVPEPKVNIYGNTIGETIDGKLFSICEAIKGKNPKLKSLKQFYSLGKVVGEITKQLSEVKTERKPIYEPCYELEKSYPTCSLNKVIDFCNNPPEEFENEKEVLNKIKKYFIEFKEIIPRLRDLPHQYIHGDINASNVLEDEDNNVCAVLDFEFAARDLRCMDLAICLSEAIANETSEKVKFDNMRSLAEGYSKYISLLDEEIDTIPYLIMLRRLDVIVHFLVRYQKGISNSYITAEQVLKEQIHKGENLCRWVEVNKAEIKRIFI